jgi:hypothetical protein
LKNLLCSKSKATQLQLTSQLVNEINVSKKDVQKGLFIDNKKLNKEIIEWLKD